MALEIHSLDSLTVQQIITFCHVYERGGYANAAEALGMAGPTLWEHVKVLEKIYQTTLFHRAGRNVEPTPEGHALYELLRPILAQFESSFEHLAEQSGHSRLHIRIVTGVRMMLEELGKPLRDFRKQFPQAHLELTTADNRAAQQYVLDGKADVALLIEPMQSFTARGLAYERLYRIDYLAVFPPRHPLNRRPELRLADLIPHPLITGTESTIGRAMLEQARFRLGIADELNIVVETDNSATTLACVRSGMGVGVIAGRTGGFLTRQLVARSLSSEVGQVNIVAAYRQGRHLTQALTQLLDLIRDQDTHVKE